MKSFLGLKAKAQTAVSPLLPPAVVLDTTLNVHTWARHDYARSEV